MKLSIIIPIYNEEETIKKILFKINELKLPLNKELILIDDFSTDKTRDILKSIKSQEIKKIYHSKNKGKGEGIRTGIKNSTGDIILIQDADLEYNPKDYPKLIYPILNNECSVVYGSRFLKKYPHKKTIFFYGNKLLSFFTSVLYFKKITDMETCYKVFNKNLKKIILNTKSKGFDIEPEITSRILRKKYKIKEVPISYLPRKENQGKKIKISDGIKAIVTLLKFRFKSLD